jgi:hypothetical protein
MANSPRYEQQQDADNPWDGIDVGGRSAPTLGDIDSDGDLDLVVGAADGMLAYYQNTGTATSPAYSQRTGSDNPWDGINLGGRSTPALEDVDGDGDLDLVGGGGRALVYCRTNRAVVLDRSLADQTFSGSGFHSFTVPADAFLDLEHDALHYLAALADGSALPEWLSFDPTTRTFRGNPEPGDVSPLQIRVTALDTDGPPLSDVFRLSLVDVTDLPPTIASNQEAVTVNQGSPASNSGTFGDAEGLSTVTLTASLGAVTRNDDGTWSWSYTPPVGTGGPSTVTITATDDGGLTATTTVTLTVN